MSFIEAAGRGCHSCRLLLQQRQSQLGFGFPHSWPDPCKDGVSYWLVWDNSIGSLVLASGENSYVLEYESVTGRRTKGKLMFLQISYT